MEQKKIKLMWRWPLVTAGIIGLFWLMWYLVAGSVPQVTEIKMTQTWTIQFPSGISRWWDILIGPIWSVVLIIVFTNTNKKNTEMAAGLIFGLIIGLASGQRAGVGLGAVLIVAIGLGIGLERGTEVGIGTGLKGGLKGGLGAMLGSMLAFELVAGL